MPVTPHMVNACCWLTLGGIWILALAWSKPNQSGESVSSRLQAVVPLGVAFFLIFYGRHHRLVIGRLYEAPALQWAGAGITIAGLAICVWARVHLGRYWSGTVALKEHHRIIRTGPYRFVRHPIYTGFIFGALGTAISAATGDAFIGLAVLTLSFLFKSRREERLLLDTFGEDYRQFMRDVPALVPGIY